MRIGVYPGTFDPVTLGHMDIIKRSAKLVDKLYVAIAADSKKTAWFSLEERVAMLEEELCRNGLTSVKVEVFNGLLVKYAHSKSATISIRGLRMPSDYEYEMQMAYMNSLLDQDIETIFLPAAASLQLVSSKFIKELATLGGETCGFVSDQIKLKLLEKISS